MKQAINIRLFPNHEQKVLMIKHVGTMRFVYNWGLNKQIIYYKETKKKMSVYELGKELTMLKKQKNYEWMNEISHATLKEALRDLEKAYKNFFNGSGFPKFKNKKKSKDKFYSRYDKIYFNGNEVNLEKIGKIRYRYDYDNDIDLTKIKKFGNPRVCFNGRVWLLTVVIDVALENESETLNNISIGIDLGIKDLAVTNIDELDVKNINKTDKVHRIRKKLKRLQRQNSRKYEKNMKGESYQKTKNIINWKRK